MTKPSIEFAVAEVMSWTDTASLPLLPSDDSAEVFAQLRVAPRLDYDDGVSWRARPHGELHATADKPFMDLVSEDMPEGFWPVYKGESFGLWEPDTGIYYAWADPAIMTPHLQSKRERGQRHSRSAFSEFSAEWAKDPATAPWGHPRIAFRDITNRTNQRTLLAALVPPNVVLTNTAPYILFPRGNQKDEAFLLGVLSSIPLDWYARRFVELHLNFFVFNPFPIPRPERAHPLWQRVVELAGRMGAADERYADWAASVGVDYGPLPEDTKQDMIYELDAAVALLYGLSKEQLIHIYETFHEGWNYTDRLAGTLKHFERLTTLEQT